MVVNKNEESYCAINSSFGYPDNESRLMSVSALEAMGSSAAG